MDIQHQEAKRGGAFLLNGMDSGLLKSPINGRTHIKLSPTIPG